MSSKSSFQAFVVFIFMPALSDIGSRMLAATVSVRAFNKIMYNNTVMIVLIRRAYSFFVEEIISFLVRTSSGEILVKLFFS